MKAFFSLSDGGSSIGEKSLQRVVFLFSLAVLSSYVFLSVPSLTLFFHFYLIFPLPCFMYIRVLFHLFYHVMEPIISSVTIIQHAPLFFHKSRDSTGILTRWAPPEFLYFILFFCNSKIYDTPVLSFCSLDKKDHVTNKF